MSSTYHPLPVFLIDTHSTRYAYGQARKLSCGGARGSGEKVTEAIVLANKAFKELDLLLSHGDWLVGDTFSLADISWAVQIHRLKTIRLRDIENYPNLVRWYKTLEERGSVKKGMLDWETPEPYVLFNHYLDQREAEETDVNSPIWRN